MTAGYVMVLSVRAPLTTALLQSYVHEVEVLQCMGLGGATEGGTAGTRRHGISGWAFETVGTWEHNTSSCMKIPFFAHSAVIHAHFVLNLFTRMTN